MGSDLHHYPRTVLRGEAPEERFGSRPNSSLLKDFPLLIENTETGETIREVDANG